MTTPTIMTRPFINSHTYIVTSCNHVEEIEMLRRKSRPNVIAGACEDTTGLPRCKKSKTGILYDEEELQEKKLEELVFGGRPFSGTNEKDLESYGLVSLYVIT